MVEKICKLINGKIQNYRIVLRKKIAACSKFAVTLAITTICYWMRIYKEKNNIFFYFSIFLFTNLLYKFDDSFFPTLHRFSIILANIEGRIKIKDISNSAWPGLLQNISYFIHRCPKNGEMYIHLFYLPFCLDTLYPHSLVYP